jgi:hypothetical protein
MPGSTPIYGFPYPDPSDLVANYPALGQQLAEDIEDVLPTLGGLTLITTATVSAANSVSINNCFTSTYSHYRIILTLVATANDQVGLRARLRVSGTDNSASSYSTNILRVSGASATASGATETFYVIGATSTTRNAATSLDIFNPQVAENTELVAQGYYSANAEMDFYGGDFTGTNQFDGITIYAASGNITGTIRVYGYRNA